MSLGSMTARTLRSFAYAGRGLKRAWRDQPNLRIEAVIGVGALLLALWLAAPLTPIVLAAGLVMALELLNSSIESLVDLASPAHHELAAAAKDMAAAAVLMAAIVSVVVGLLVLGPPLLTRLGIGTGMGPT